LIKPSKIRHNIPHGKPEGKRPLRRPRHRLESNINKGLKEMGWDLMMWVGVTCFRIVRSGGFFSVSQEVPYSI
jgi:hypothetical protein